MYCLKYYQYSILIKVKAIDRTMIRLFSNLIIVYDLRQVL